MPHLVRWHDELSDFGLVIIAVHRQKAEDGELKAKAQKMGMRFSVPESGSHPGHKGGGIPDAMLFDHTGKVIFDGHPDKAETKLRAAVGEGLIAASGIGSPEKAIQPVVDALKKGQSPAAALTKLNNLSRGTDAASGQAKKLVEAMLAGGQKRLDDAVAQASEEPLASYETVLRLSTSFKNTPLAAKVNEQLTKLKADKTVQLELRAKPTLDQVKKLDAVLAPRAAKGDPASAEFKKANAGLLKQMDTALKQLKRNYADTHAAKEAEEIASKYEFGK